MKTDLFKLWLQTCYVQRNGQLLAPGTQVSRIANCSTVEQVEGDLDAHFAQDGMDTLLARLTYTTEEKTQGRRPLHRIPINGDEVNGTMTYRSAIQLYRKFLTAMQSGDDFLLATVMGPLPKAASARREITARLGQQRFRHHVMELWDYRCAVTGADIMLAASHIKPWKDSLDSERLDGFNGLCLSPLFDKAFDAGFITFDDTGMICISPALTLVNLEKLGITPGTRIMGLGRRHRTYMAHHRDSVWIR